MKKSWERNNIKVHFQNIKYCVYNCQKLTEDGIMYHRLWPRRFLETRKIEYFWYNSESKGIYIYVYSFKEILKKNNNYMNTRLLKWVLHIFLSSFYYIHIVPSDTESMMIWVVFTFADSFVSLCCPKW